MIVNRNICTSRLNILNTTQELPKEGIKINQISVKKSSQKCSKSGAHKRKNKNRRMKTNWFEMHFVRCTRHFLILTEISHNRSEKYLQKNQQTNLKKLIKKF